MTETLCSVGLCRKGDWAWNDDTGERAGPGVGCKRVTQYGDWRGNARLPLSTEQEDLDLCRTLQTGARNLHMCNLKFMKMMLMHKYSYAFTHLWFSVTIINTRGQLQMTKIPQRRRNSLCQHSNFHCQLTTFKKWKKTDFTLALLKSKH